MEGILYGILIGVILTMAYVGMDYKYKSGLNLRPSDPPVEYLKNRADDFLVGALVLTIFFGIFLILKQILGY